MLENNCAAVPFVFPIIYLPVWATGSSSFVLCCHAFIKTPILCFILYLFFILKHEPFPQLIMLNGGKKRKKNPTKMRISFPNHSIYSNITGHVQVCFGLFPSQISLEAEFRVRAQLCPMYPTLGAFLGIPTWRANSEPRINCFRCLFLTSLLTE